MSIHQEKLVLGGGMVTKLTLDAAIELSGSEHPNILIDTSPKYGVGAYEKAVEDITDFAHDCGIGKPIWLRAEFNDDPSEPRKSDLIDKADILMVTGGSTLRAYERWRQAGIVEQVKNRVESGSMVGYGASAGAMIWFNRGYSDSLQYEPEGNQA